jgi:hypothetical protein
MNPGSVTDSFGTARRRNVPLFQFLNTMLIYGAILLVVFIIVTKSP